MIRLNIGPSPRIITLPETYSFKKGQGCVLVEGDDAVLIGYGPVLLHEALRASEILKKSKISLKVINMPWLNVIDSEWIKQIIKQNCPVFILEDHSPVGGLGDRILSVISSGNLLQTGIFKIIGVEGYLAWGRPWEALRYHHVDGESIAEKIRSELV